MTKEQLRDYQAIKKELAQLRTMSRRVDLLDTADLVGLYEQKQAALTADILRIEEAIEGLQPVERLLMRLRYIEGRPWQTICQRIGYSWQQTHRIHARALIKIQDK